LSKFDFCQFEFPLVSPDYPVIFLDSLDFLEYPEKYPKASDLVLTAGLKLANFRFDYSPPLVDILILLIGIRAKYSEFEA
jgi:hypothetical protein